MMIKKQICIACFFALSMCSLRAGASVSADSLTVISPKRFETLYGFPVPVVIEFGQGIESGTFRALLNDVDVTHVFEKTGEGVQAAVGLEHGLRVKTKEAFLQTPNMLKIKAEALDPEEDVDFETYFFVNVDRLVTIGPKGGTIQSLDNRLVVGVPEGALSSGTIAGVAEVRGRGSTGPAYQVSPEGMRFNRPVRVTLKYTPEELPADVTESDLFVVSDNGFPRKLDRTVVDKTSGTVSGIAFSTARFFLSYTIIMGKKPTQVPFAEDFRFPLGDVSAGSYTCGRAYEPPRDGDLGEALNLLQRSSSFAGSHEPGLVFNEPEKENTWEVGKAFGWKRSLDPHSGFGPSGDAAGGADEEIWNNGEDWRFIGSAPVPEALSVHAVADGLVIYNGPGFGETIVLAHRIPGDLVFSIYSNLKEKSPCLAGTAVHRGNIIGKIQGPESKRAHLHFGIGKADLIEVDAGSGEFKVPAVWVEEWRQEQVRELFYEPTNFILNIAGAYKWDFNVNGNSRGWDVKSDGEPVSHIKDGTYAIVPACRHFQLVSYPLKVKTASFDSVFITIKSSAEGGAGRAYFKTDEKPVYSESRVVPFQIEHDGAFHEYRVYMADHPDWRGAVIGIRLDFFDVLAGEAARLDLDQIRLGRAYLSKVPDTAQSKCYDNTREIICPGPNEPFYGQDAHYEIHPPGYEVATIDGHEVILDQVTGLMWLRRDDETKRTWQEAVEYCEHLDLAGYSDWRLPTKKELQSIGNFGHADSADDMAHFPDLHEPEACYWSASTRAFLALSAWTVCPWNSEVRFDIKSDGHPVRAVRGRPLEFGDFRDNGDGTVTDIATGLMWQQAEDRPMTWETALAYCQDLDLGGYDDWRLPDIRELSGLVDDLRRNPSIDTAYFPGCRPANYWSGTSYARYPDFAWYVRFADGRVQQGGQKGRQYYVRAVRGGE